MQVFRIHALVRKPYDGNSFLCDNQFEVIDLLNMVMFFFFRICVPIAIKIHQAIAGGAMEISASQVAATFSNHKIAH